MWRCCGHDLGAHGCVCVAAVWCRGNSSHGSRFVQVRLTLRNKNSYPLTGLRVASNTAASGQHFVEFAGPIDVPSEGDCTVRLPCHGAATWVWWVTLGCGGLPCVQADVHVDFDGRVPIKFELVASEWRETLKLAPPAGELLTAVTQSEADFDDTAGRLGGMHENQTTVTLGEGVSPATLAQRVGDAANVSAVVCAPSTSSRPGARRCACCAPLILSHLCVCVCLFVSSSCVCPVLVLVLQSHKQAPRSSLAPRATPMLRCVCACRWPQTMMAPYRPR